MAYFCLAEINQLKKLQAAKPKENKLEEIMWPSKFQSLQHAMGLTDDKKLYSYCWVSLFFFLSLYAINPCYI